jgi:hypothetical protein
MEPAYNGAWCPVTGSHDPCISYAMILMKSRYLKRNVAMNAYVS